MKTNFLNAQNYILGKTEKKKLLSKFFIERNIWFIFKILSKVNNNFSKGQYLFLMPLFIILLMYYNKSSVDYLIFFGIIFGIVSLVLFIGINILKPKQENTKITNFKNYFWGSFNEKGEGRGTIMFLKLIGGIFLLGFLINFIGTNFPSIKNNYTFIILLILTLIGPFIFMILKILNTLLFPLLVIFEFFIFIYSLIYIFIFKGIKGFLFEKLHPESKILKKFNSIEKYGAENNNYILMKK